MDMVVRTSQGKAPTISTHEERNGKTRREGRTGFGVSDGRRARAARLVWRLSRVEPRRPAAGVSLHGAGQTESRAANLIWPDTGAISLWRADRASARGQRRS